MTDPIEERMIEFFEPLDLLGPADPACSRRALGSVQLGPEFKVVDAGCGTGRQTLQLLQETEASVTATDLSQSLLNIKFWLKSQ